MFHDLSKYWCSDALHLRLCLVRNAEEQIEEELDREERRKCWEEKYGKESISE